MKYFIFFYILCLFFVSKTQAQSIEHARRLYLEGKYADALPVFENIVNSTSKKTATQKQEACLSLGHIYYINYEFEKSADAFSKCADLLQKDKKTIEAAEITLLSERSGRAARMLSRCEDIQWIDSVIVDKNHFLNAYILSSENGRLENQNGRLVYENPLGDKRYYALKTTGQGKRLYSEIKIQNEWTDQKEITIPADSLEDNDYPFVLSDGLTIYYASNGKNSIGGYDLFISRYNINNNSWLAPSQMGMPFNSIANDYMMAIDEINHIAYFATDRFQPEDKVIIYTFIPNNEIISLQTNNAQELIRRAQITSIRESWKPNINYLAYLEQVRQSIRNEQVKPEHDFDFIINDNIQYHSLNDFKNDAAKQAFLKAKELKRSIDQLEKELDKLRRTYSQSDERKKQSMYVNITAKEERLLNLYPQYEQTMKNARNFEIRTK